MNVLTGINVSLKDMLENYVKKAHAAGKKANEITSKSLTDYIEHVLELDVFDSHDIEVKIKLMGAGPARYVEIGNATFAVIDNYDRNLDGVNRCIWTMPVSVMVGDTYRDWFDPELNYEDFAPAVRVASRVVEKEMMGL